MNERIHWFQFVVTSGIYWAVLSFQQGSSFLKVNWKRAVILVLWVIIVYTKASAVQHRQVWGSWLWMVQGTTMSVEHQGKQKTEKISLCTSLNDLQWSKFSSLNLTWVPSHDTEVICVYRQMFFNFLWYTHELWQFSNNNSPIFPLDRYLLLFYSKRSNLLLHLH